MKAFWLLLLFFNLFREPAFLTLVTLKIRQFYGAYKDSRSVFFFFLIIFSNWPLCHSTYLQSLSRTSMYIFCYVYYKDATE